MKTFVRDIIIMVLLLAFASVLFDDLTLHRQYADKNQQLHEALRMVDKLLTDENKQKR